MFETDNIIFIHFPKTAGTFVHNFIKDQCQTKPEIIKNTFKSYGLPNKHSTISIENKKKLNKHVLGIIRNPFDLYVSWYTWSFTSRRIFTLWKKDIFKEYRDVKSFRKWLKLALTKHFYNTQIPKNYDEDIDTKNYIDLDIGYLTWLFLKMYYWSDFNFLANSKLNYIADSYVKTETLYDDLSNYFSFEKKVFDEYQKINKTKRHTDYRKYYDDELKELVYYKDRYLFNKFDYVF
jgi:hypothetical protein